MGARASWETGEPGVRRAGISSPDVIRQSLEAAPLYEFSCGSNGRPPSRDVGGLARRLSTKAVSSTNEPEITVDVDGALSFDLRLDSGLLMFAELQVDGSLSLTTLDDSRQETSVVDHLPSATESQFVDRL